MFCRFLLLLLPASFRNEYGAGMQSVYAARRREVSNIFAWLGLWLDLIADVVVTAVQSHWDILRQDLRQTVRTMRRSPGFTIAAIAVSALGIGATTAAFSLADHVLIRPLPFKDADRLVSVWESLPNYSEMEPSPANYRDWKRMSHAFESMAAWRGLSANMSGDGEPVNLQGASVEYGLFPMLGAQPALGRLFNAEDYRPGAPGTLVLSDALWRTRFGADPHALGMKVLLDKEPYIVIGVMPPDFCFPRSDIEMWAPMRFVPADFEDRGNTYLHVLAKLPPGSSEKRALGEMRAVAAELEKLYPKENSHVSVTILNFREQVSQGYRILLLALAAASLCLLLITCTNLANLLLARSMARRKEIAVRTALGAGRERLVRQLLTESVLLAIAGGILGILLAAEVTPLLAKLVPIGLPIAETPHLDLRVLAIAGIFTMLTAIGFGALPAMQSAKSGVSGLHERSGAGGRRERLRGALVAGQVASSVVLLISCGLILRALWRVESVNPGFQPSRVLTMRTSLPMPQYERTATRVQFYSKVLASIRALPGVGAAGYTSFLPLGDNRGGVWPVAVRGETTDPRAQQRASMRFVTPGFFATLGTPLLSGRDVSESDTVHTLKVAVVSQSFVRRYWPDRNPLGQTFHFAESNRTVVGVVGDVRVRGLDRSSEPQVYLPYRQVEDGWFTWYAPKDLAIRSSSPRASLLPAIRRIVAEADPAQPISDIQELSAIVASDTAPRSIQATVLGGFALLASLLAALGIHGLLSFAVSQRAPEIGIRMALGARPGNILAMITGEGALLSAAGVAIGAGKRRDKPA